MDALIPNWEAQIVEIEQRVNSIQSVAPMNPLPDLSNLDAEIKFGYLGRLEPGENERIESG